MREDMSKVLVERPRVGHDTGERVSRHARRTYKQNLRLVKDDEDSNFDSGANTESISAHTKGHPKRYSKELNENLKPLRRFLRSRLGKPWDKVYSEIMAGFNMQNAVQYHVWQHLINFGEVETKTYMEGNTVMIWGGCPRSVGSWYRDEFYVHPKTGLLCVAAGRSWKDRRTAPSSQLSYIDPKKPLIQYHQIDDIWYEVQFRRATDDEMAKKQFGHYVRDYDRVLNKIVYKWQFVESSLANELKKGRGFEGNWRVNQLWNCCENLFGGPYLPLRKQQIGTREIRRIEKFLAEKKKAA